MRGTPVELPTTADVVVVGAGFAGLIAARNLSHAGLDVAVLEAQDRIGGRVWSETLSNGLVVERGAQNINVDDAVVRRTAAEFSLEIVEHEPSEYERIFVDQEAVDFAEIATTSLEFRRFYDEMVEVNPTATVAAVLEGFDSPPWIKRLMRNRLSSLAGADAADLGARWVPSVDVIVASADNPSGEVRGGNQRIAECLAAEAAVFTRTAVARVTVTRGGYEVQTVLGSSIAARAVIVAIPLPMLPLIDFQPGLPAEYVIALQSMGWGVAAKLSIPVLSGELRGTISELGEPAVEIWPHNYRGDLPQAITSYIGGPSVDRLISGRSIDRWQKAVFDALPDVRLGEYVVATDWMRNPWIRGAYSHRTARWLPEMSQTLATPVDGLAFCGEHTFPATGLASMDRALQTGERSAEQIARFLT